MHACTQRYETMCMHVCVCIEWYVCIICVQEFVSVSVYLCVCVCVCVCVCWFFLVCINICVWEFVCVCVSMYVCVCINIWFPGDNRYLFLIPPLRFEIPPLEVRKEGRKEMFYLTTHSTHFIYGYPPLEAICLWCENHWCILFTSWTLKTCQLWTHYKIGPQMGIDLEWMCITREPNHWTKKQKVMHYSAINLFLSTCYDWHRITVNKKMCWVCR